MIFAQWTIVLTLGDRLVLARPQMPKTGLGLGKKRFPLILFLYFIELSVLMRDVYQKSMVITSFIHTGTGRLYK